MSKTRIAVYALIVFLLLPLITFAETQEMKEHKVIKGDTLWDISKENLNDPFLWPKIWKENSWIANPHWIYPNQMIKIPLYLIQQEKRGGEAASKPEATSQEPTGASQESAEASQETTAASNKALTKEVKKEAVQIVESPLVHKNLLAASGYITDTIPGVGKVIGSPTGQTLFGNDDLAYVTINLSAPAVDKFYVIKATGPVKHPTTGKEIGYVITIGGIAEIVKKGSSKTMVKITKCFGEMHKGDRLLPYYDIEPPMTTGHFRSPDIKGMIVATANNAALQSMPDIIYIDKGCKDGIEVGDMFSTIAVDTLKEGLFKALEIVPQLMPNGVIQVINCRDHTATVIIRSSKTPIVRGNIFAELDKD